MKPNKELATKHQKAILHIGKQALGLSDEDYRDILEVCGGVRSSTGLDQDGVSAVIEAYKKMGWEPAGGYNPRRRNGRTRHVRPRNHEPNGPITQPMMAKIQHLYADLGWHAPEKQQAFSRRQCGHPWPQTRRHATKVMEGLKAILSRRNRKAQSNG